MVTQFPALHKLQKIFPEILRGLNHMPPVSYPPGEVLGVPFKINPIRHSPIRQFTYEFLRWIHHQQIFLTSSRWSSVSQPLIQPRGNQALLMIKHERNRALFTGIFLIEMIVCEPSVSVRAIRSAIDSL